MIISQSDFECKSKDETISGMPSHETKLKEE
jgi:hypothetical protein